MELLGRRALLGQLRVVPPRCRAANTSSSRWRGRVCVLGGRVFAMFAKKYERTAFVLRN